MCVCCKPTCDPGVLGSYEEGETGMSVFKVLIAGFQRGQGDDSWDEVKRRGIVNQSFYVLF